MMMKDPQTKLVINRDESHYEVLKLRRQQRKQAKLVDQQLFEVANELKTLRQELFLIKQQD